MTATKVKSQHLPPRLSDPLCPPAAFGPPATNHQSPITNQSSRSTGTGGCAQGRSDAHYAGGSPGPGPDPGCGTCSRRRTRRGAEGLSLLVLVFVSVWRAFHVLLWGRPWGGDGARINH